MYVNQYQFYVLSNQFPSLVEYKHIHFTLFVTERYKFKTHFKRRVVLHLSIYKPLKE